MRVESLIRDESLLWLVGPDLWSMNAGVERCVKTWAPRLASRGRRVVVGALFDTPPSLVDGVPWVGMTPDQLERIRGVVLTNSWVDSPVNRGGHIHHSTPLSDDDLARYESALGWGPKAPGKLTQSQYAQACSSVGAQAAVSKYVQEAVRNRLGLACEFIPLFAHEAFGQGESTFAARDVLFASRFTRRKGAHLALQVAASMPEVTFTIVAGAEEHDLDKQLLELSRSSRVVRLTPMSDPWDVAAVVASHRVLCLPTPVLAPEAFGLLSIEAQHAGVRVVATRSGGLSETDCGLLTQVNDDPQSLLAGLTEALNKPPVSPRERYRAQQLWTIDDSVSAIQAWADSI
jgi:glycosyltransferase involved in cell wall biosynthesis